MEPTAARPEPPGRLIDVGGYRLHLSCRGKERPAVVFESAMWEPGLTWALVQPEVARFARACTYDRAGLGWSEPSPRPRNADSMLEELRALLRNAAIPSPYVLVAHSSGGILARLYAHRHPQEVAGLVLVDGAHEEQFERFPEPIRRVQRPMWDQQWAVLEGIRGMVEAGTLDPAMIPVPPQLPEEAAAAYRSVAGTTVAVDTMLRELDGLDDLHAQARAARILSLGDLPLVVLRHGAPLQPFPEEHGIGPEDMEEYEQQWVQLQEEIAALSSGGRVVRAAGAGHTIHHERPGLVVDAIREVVKAAGEG